MAASYFKVGPFPSWSGMMTHIWQQKAKQLWLESDKPVSKKIEAKVKNSWMMMMGEAWKELGVKQPDYRSRSRWKKAVINCCQKVNKSLERNPHNDHMMDKYAQDDTSTAEGLKQRKEKRKMWRKTMRKCWKQAVGAHAKKEKMRRMKNQVSGTDYKKQWRQMMRQMMNGNCPTSLQEMKKKKQLMTKWWQKQQQKNDKKTRKSESNKSHKSGVNTEYRPNIFHEDTNINIKGGRYYYIKTQYHLNISLLGISIDFRIIWTAKNYSTLQMYKAVSQ